MHILLIYFIYLFLLLLLTKLVTCCINYFFTYIFQTHFLSERGCWIRRWCKIRGRRFSQNFTSRNWPYSTYFKFHSFWSSRSVKYIYYFSFATNCFNFIWISHANDFIFSCSWRNWIIRTIFTWFMIAGFCLIIYGGPLALMITVSFLYQILYN